MMRLRQIVWATLPGALLAISALAPGLSAAPPASAKQQKASKAQTHAAAQHKVAVRRVHLSRYRSRYRPSPNRIGQIQEALARTGFYSGDVTGKWDSQTVEAMKAFQQAHNIPPTGKINATSLQELGLGSNIAGLAPPRPVIGAPSSGSSE